MVLKPQRVRDILNIKFKEQLNQFKINWLHVRHIATYKLVQILPVVLGHEAESRQESPAEGVEARVAVVGVRPEALQTHVARFALPEDNVLIMKKT